MLTSGEAVMFRFIPKVPRKEEKTTGGKRPIFSTRRLDPPLESAFIFPANEPRGFRVNERKKGKKPISENQ